MSSKPPARRRPSDSPSGRQCLRFPSRWRQVIRHRGRSSRGESDRHVRELAIGMDRTETFERERPRLVRLAAGVLHDDAEAEDIVQTAWLRLERHDQDIDCLPAWLTTVTTRLCLDRLRARTPTPVSDVAVEAAVPDVAEDVSLADTVGIALQVVLDRLSASERVAFVLHDSFGFEFPTIATILDTTPTAARKLASRARAKVRQSPPRGQDVELGGRRRVHGSSARRRLRTTDAAAGP